jgi:hypothetical protein
MRVLIACEFSGIVRDAFAARGHDAWSCDLLPTERPGNHIQGDVLAVLNDGWDLMVAHPPCTYLSNSGVSWLFKDFNRWADMARGAVFFRKFLDAPIPKIAVENPIPHKHAMQIIDKPYSQRIQPFEFGHPESKATCLWLKNLPPLMITDNVQVIMNGLPKREAQRLHYLPPSEDRAHIRSTTFSGIAKAMAEQWG